MEQIEEKKTKSPYRALYWIPIMIVILAISVFVGAGLDGCMIKWSHTQNVQGHPIPLFTIIVPGFTFVVGAVVSLISIIVTIVRCLKK